LPHLVHFSSLSPIPGFRVWLMNALQAAKRDDPEAKGLFTKEEVELLLKKDSSSEGRGDCIAERLLRLVQKGSWAEDEDLSEVAEKPFLRLCARYLYTEKHRSFALDPVANFHVRNGAVLWRLNWRADLSSRGMNNSCGMMVNYKYFLDDLEENSSNYQENGVIKSSEQILHLADQAKQLAQ